MKKIKSLLVMILVATLVICCIPGLVNATDMKSAVGSLNSDSADLGKDMNDMVLKILSFIRGIAVAAALISVLVIGVKIIVGSSEEKAKYKEMLLPLVIGVIIVVFGTTIISYLWGLKSTTAGGGTHSFRTETRIETRA